MSDYPRVVETALACLHKLVAYSYLQDENTRSGRLNDQTTVAQARRSPPLHSKWQVTCCACVGSLVSPRSLCFAEMLLAEHGSKGAFADSEVDRT